MNQNLVRRLRATLLSVSLIDTHEAGLDRGLAESLRHLEYKRDDYLARSELEPDEHLAFGLMERAIGVDRALLIVWKTVHGESDTLPTVGAALGMDI